MQVMHNSSCTVLADKSSIQLPWATKNTLGLLNSMITHDTRCSQQWRSSCSLLGCDTMQWRGRIPMFQRTMFPPSSGWNENEGSKVLQNVGILPCHYKVSQPKRLQLWRSMSITIFKFRNPILVAQTCVNE